MSSTKPALAGLGTQHSMWQQWEELRKGGVPAGGLCALHQSDCSAPRCLRV